MAEKGKQFYQQLLDGKIHLCEYVEPYEGTKLWIAKIIDDHGGYRKGQTFICDPSY